MEFEFPEPNELLYRKSSQNKLSVIRQPRNDVYSGLTAAVRIRELLDAYFNKKHNEVQELLIHIEELDYSYSEERIAHAEYLYRYDAFRVRLEHAASEALITTEGTRFLEEQLTAELLKGVPYEDWPNLQIQHDEAMKVLEDLLRRNTFAEDKQPRKRNREFRRDIIERYGLRLTLPASHPVPHRGWLPPQGFVNGDPASPDNSSYLLDQVTGVWHHEQSESSTLRAAHLVPHKFIGKPLESLCGITREEVHHFRNGLLMHKNLEKAFDEGRICLVPVTVTEPIQWKCIVIDQEIMNKTYTESHYWFEVHNRTLTSVTDDRPSRTACYFRFLLAWLRASATQRTGIESNHSLKGLRFVTPNKMVDASVLSALALHVGDKKDWLDLQASQGHALYEGSNAETPTLAQLQGVRLGGILLMLTIRSRKLEEGEIESDDDE